MTPQHYKQLIDAALVGDSWRCLAIAISAATGARINEILKLNESALVINESGLEREKVFVKITASKQSRDRLIPLPSCFLARVKSLKESLRGKDGACLAWLCNDASRTVATAYALLRRDFMRMQIELWGEVKYTTHDFRHNMATMALKSGMDIVKVKRVLGQKNIQNTMVYLERYEDSVTLDEIPGLVPV